MLADGDQGLALPQLTFQGGGELIELTEVIRGRLEKGIGGGVNPTFQIDPLRALLQAGGQLRPSEIGGGKVAGEFAALFPAGAHSGKLFL